MKITAVEPVALSMPVVHRAAVPLLAGVPRKSMEILLVRVATDEGLVGWGEIFGLFNAWPAAREALVQLVTPLCLGADPLDRNALTDRVLRALHPLGRNGAVVCAWSGMEMALWDLAGKALGVPVHRLLGGAQVQRLDCYASLPRYGQVAPVVHDCEEAVARGYGAVKVHEMSVPVIRAAAESVARLGIPGLMVDANCPWSLNEALAVGRELADLDLKWLEEPLYPADDYEGLARLRAECGIPIAAGETASSLADFDTMRRLHAVDYVQPSVPKIGGIGAMQQAFATVAGSALEIAPHSPFFGPALVADLHLCAALAPRARIESYFLDLAGNPFEAFIKPRDGTLAVPQEPGLGCDPDPQALARCRI